MPPSVTAAGVLGDLCISLVDAASRRRSLAKRSDPRRYLPSLSALAVRLHADVGAAGQGQGHDVPRPFILSLAPLGRNHDTDR